MVRPGDKNAALPVMHREGLGRLILHTESAEYGQSTSITLIQRLQRNEPLAWERFCRIYSTLVWRWSMDQHGLLSREDREDVIQTVFARIPQAIPEFERMRLGSFRRWLKVMTKNVVCDTCRKRGTVAAGGTDAWIIMQQVQEDTQETLERETQELDRNALRSIDLGLESRDVEVMLQLMRGRQPAEVALSFGLTRNNVYVIKNRVKEKLRIFLGRADEIVPISEEL